MHPVSENAAAATTASGNLRPQFGNQVRMIKETTGGAGCFKKAKTRQKKAARADCPMGYFESASRDL
jgi:hypothetical protein